MTLDSQRVGDGPTRYPVGISPILDANTLEVPIDAGGRRSYATSTSYCPSIGEHVVMGYLPAAMALPGKKLVLEYFNEKGNGHYPMTVQIAGRGSLYDPDNERVRA
jgi:glycine cleavage system aminomethyltransferase T